MPFESFVQRDIRELLSRFEVLVGHQVYRLKGDPSQVLCSSSVDSLVFSNMSSLDESRDTHCVHTRHLQRNSNALSRGDLDREPIFGLPYLVQSLSPVLSLLIVCLQEDMRINNGQCNSSCDVIKRFRNNKRNLLGVYKRSLVLESQLHEYINPSLVTSLNRRLAKASCEVELMVKMIDRLRKTARKASSDPKCKVKACELTRRLKALLGRQKCEWQCVGRLKETLTMGREMRGVLKFICQLSRLLEQRNNEMYSLHEGPPPYEYCNPMTGTVGSVSGFHQAMDLGPAWDIADLLDSSADSSCTLGSEVRTSYLPVPSKKSQSEITISLSLDFEEDDDGDDDVRSGRYGYRGQGRCLSSSDQCVSDSGLARASRQDRATKRKHRSSSRERKQRQNRGSPILNRKQNSSLPKRRSKSSPRSNSRMQSPCKSCRQPHKVKRSMSPGSSRGSPGGQRVKVQISRPIMSSSSSCPCEHSEATRLSKAPSERLSRQETPDSSDSPRGIMGRLAHECASAVQARSPGGTTGPRSRSTIRAKFDQPCPGNSSPTKVDRGKANVGGASNLMRQRSRTQSTGRQGHCAGHTSQTSPGRSVSVSPRCDHRTDHRPTRRCSGHVLSDIEGSKDHLVDASQTPGNALAGQTEQQERQSTPNKSLVSPTLSSRHCRTDASSPCLSVKVCKGYMEPRTGSNDSSGSREPLLMVSSTDNQLSMDDENFSVSVTSRDVPQAGHASPCRSPKAESACETSFNHNGKHPSMCSPRVQGCVIINLSQTSTCKQARDMDSSDSCQELMQGLSSSSLDESSSKLHEVDADDCEEELRNLRTDCQECWEEMDGAAAPSGSGRQHSGASPACDRCRQSLCRVCASPCVSGAGRDGAPRGGECRAPCPYPCSPAPPTQSRSSLICSQYRKPCGDYGSHVTAQTPTKVGESGRLSSPGLQIYGPRPASVRESDYYSRPPSVRGSVDLPRPPSVRESVDRSRPPSAVSSDFDKRPPSGSVYDLPPSNEREATPPREILATPEPRRDSVPVSEPPSQDTGSRPLVEEEEPWYATSKGRQEFFQKWWKFLLLLLINLILLYFLLCALMSSCQLCPSPVPGFIMQLVSYATRSVKLRHYSPAPV